MTKLLAILTGLMLLLPLGALATDDSAVIVARAGGDNIITLSECVELCLKANDRLKAERLRMSELIFDSRR